MLKKKILLFLFAVLSYSFAIACSFPTKTFCRTYFLSPEIPTVTGKIVGIDDQGIDLQIIEILRGEEIAQTIRIWDGTDFECNGPWSMAASDLGELNDTVIIMLDQIVEQENDWDVIGDYRRPDPYGETPDLALENGIVKGLVSGINQAPFEFQIWDMEYQLFKQRIIEDVDCSLIVSTEEITNLSAIKLNNPFVTELQIQIEEPIAEGFLKLYSYTGQIMFNQNISNQKKLELNTSNLPTGIYFLEIWADKRQLNLIKIVKI